MIFFHRICVLGQTMRAIRCGLYLFRLNASGRQTRNRILYFINLKGLQATPKKVPNLQTDSRPTESVTIIYHLLQDVLFRRLIFRRRVASLMDFVRLRINNNI